MRDITENYPPRVARAIWKDTLVDAAVFREWMTSIGRRRAPSRIAHLMCEVFTRLQAVGLAEEDRIAWPITQNEIGDALGLSNVHVNRSLQELRAMRLITLRTNVLIIHDWEELKRVGDFDAGYLHMDGGPSIQGGSRSAAAR
jgi:CRP-like cAMP-binding protein